MIRYFVSSVVQAMSRLPYVFRETSSVAYQGLWDRSAGYSLLASTRTTETATCLEASSSARLSCWS